MNDPKTTDAISRSQITQIVTEWPKRLGIVDPSNSELYAERVGCLETLAAVRHEIDRIPALDVAPVVHGKFLRYPEVAFPDVRITPILCHTCKTTFATLNKNSKKAMCCPYCGARMDGEAE